MMHRAIWLCGAFVFSVMGPGLALGTDLNVSATSGGSSSVSVQPGATVNYDVSGILSDDLNEGLALVLFDLSFDGGALTPGAAPVSAPMSNFVRPLGVTNPAGYGGTLVGGSLVQCGGAQNTIKNTMGNAPFPTGTVIPDVAAASGSPVTFLSGSLTAPMAPGNYTLSLTNVAASVIRDGEDGSGAFWAVDLAGTGTVGNLTINVASAPQDPIVAGAGPRYLGINLGNRTSAFALLVTPTCGGGVSKYVGAPAGVNHVARLVDNPGDAAFLTATQWNVSGNTIYLTGDEIVPGQAYELETDIGTPGNPNLLPALGTATWAWGDVNNSLVVDVDDILCCLDTFSGIFVTCSLLGTDLMGIDPNEIIDVDDILAALDAFQGIGYTGASPCP